MASGGEEGIWFELPVRYSVTPKHSTGPKGHNNIFKYLEKEISSFQKFMETVEEMNFIHITSVSKPEKGDKLLFMGFYVADVDQLARLYEVSHKTEKNNSNDLSYRLTDYFRNQEMPIACELTSNTTITFKVIMDKDTRQDLEKKLQQKKARSCSRPPTETVSPVDKDKGTVQEDPKNHSGSHTLMTFMVDADENSLKSVRMRSDSIQELNSEISWKRKNIYSVDIILPSSYNPDACYWYEFTFNTHVFWFFHSTKEFKTGKLTVGNKSVHRDIIMSVYTHFEDIIHYNSFEFNESELCMQIEDVASRCSTVDVQAVLGYLLQTGIEYTSRRIIRFSLVVGNLCKGYPYKIKQTIKPKIANEMLESLFTRKLSEFPTTASNYLPDLCITLLEIAYEKRFCAFLCIEKMRSFLSPKQMIDVLRGFITKSKCIVCSDPSCVSLVTSTCSYYFKEFTAKETNEYLDICALFLRHLPFELALECYKTLKNTSRISEEAVTALAANIRSRIVSASKEALKEKKMQEILDITIKAGEISLTDDTIIRKTLEDGIIRCFETFHIPISVDLKVVVDDIIKRSGCFTDCETQKQLLRSIAESKTASSRQLLIDLSRHPHFEKAYCELDVETYVTCLLNRIKALKVLEAGGS